MKQSALRFPAQDKIKNVGSILKAI